MDETERSFLERLLSTATPSGFETAGQKTWLEYVEPHADEVRVDDYGNAVAVYEGASDTPAVALGGHGDEIGMMVRDVTDDGFLKLTRIGGSDRTVSRGQRVRIHTADGPVAGVIGQVAIHLRDQGDEEYDDIDEQHVDVGAEDEAEARQMVDIGDPVTFDTTVTELAGGLLSARGMDNRVGIWTAAEAFRRAVEAAPDTTIYAVSTVQEEVGLKGAQMVGFDLDPDAFVAIDVTHATDTPDAPNKGSGVELGAGPVVARGSANHPVLVETVRGVAADEGIDVQLQASGSRTGTDADAVYTSRGGIPSLNLGLPNRYMHTPTEVIDPADLTAAADLLGSVAVRADEFAPFAVDI
ncbi:MAG: M20/M25/M40 family metallo-hydrolase [Natronomonas sp.]